jgi:alpha-galactosidase
MPVPLHEKDPAVRNFQLATLCFALAIFGSQALCLQGAQANSGGAGDNRAAAPLIEEIAAGEAISFVYDGKRSQDILQHWRRSESVKSLSGGRKLRVTTYRDPATGLEVTSEITTFSDAPAVECILRLRNTGTRDTPIIEDILPLDMKFAVPGTDKILMHYARGSSGSISDFVPSEKEVVSGTEVDLTHYVMKGDNQAYSQAPFFDLEWQGGGLIWAVGWTGQWALRLSGESGRGLVLQAGQQKTHLRLHSGESIRTPRMLLMQWQGSDPLLGHNQFRRLLLAHYVPRVDGQIVVPPVSNGYFFVHVFDAIAKETGENPLAVAARATPEQQAHINDLPAPAFTKQEAHFNDLATDALNEVNEKNQLDLIHDLDSAGIEAYWLDAGWFESGWPGGAGSWIPDPKKFPNGLKPVGDAAHAKGLKFILWFEPARVTHISRIAAEHPAWVLHVAGKGGQKDGLFNYADPAALRWMTASMSEKIDAWGVDIFRNDNNFCPLPFWPAADGPDRQGITENHWVEGWYGLWDALLRTHPKLEIDNANWVFTGRDIEAMSRSVGSLTRSTSYDGMGIPADAESQSQTGWLSPWVPINAGLIVAFTPYSFRSEATMGGAIGLDLRSPYVPLDQIKAGIAELKSLRPYWLGDYYPLTEINLDEHAWSGWEFYRPDLNAGFAVLFRRSFSTQSSFEASLRGLDPAASYEVTFARTYEVGERRTLTGEQLKHLRVEIDTAPGSVLIRYRKTNVTQR